MFAVCVIRDPDSELNAGKGKQMYSLLVSYADVGSRNTGLGYPYRAALADCMDCSKQTVDRTGTYLEEIGLVKTVRRKVEGKEDENDANLYQIYDAWLIHGLPPPGDTPPQLVARYGHTIPGLDIDAWMEEHAPTFDLAAWRAAHSAKRRAQQAKREEQRRKERARRKKPKKGGGVTHDASGGVMGDALSRAGDPEPSSTTNSAPAARSVGDVRSTTDVGSAHDASGCAAPGKTASSSGEEDPAAALPAPRSDSDGGTDPTRRPRDYKSPGNTASGPELTRDQVAAVHAVEAGLPAELRAALPYGHIPGRNRPAVLEALDSRTPQQLAVRADRRWRCFGYRDAFRAGEVDSAIGLAVKLIAPTPYCPDPSCDDGWIELDVIPCKACAMRRSDRRAARRAGLTVPTGRTGTGRAPMPECHDCGHPFPGAVPDDGLCAGCRQEAAADDDQAAAEVRAVADRLARANAEWEQRKAEAAAREAEEEQQRRDTETATEDARRQDAEETARERVRIAQEFPALAAYAQAPQAATAPF